MSQAKYKWDIEALEQQLGQLRTEYEELMEGKAFLATLREDVQKNWRSIAGEAYKGKMDADMKNYESILKELKERIDKLDRIIHSAYAACEEDIEKEVLSISGRVSAL